MVGAATDAVWIDVLPSMRGFGPALSKGVGSAATDVGDEAGGKFGKAMLAGIAVVATGAALATKALYNVGLTFSDMSTKIAVSTGASGRDLDRMNEAAKRIGREVPRSFTEIGDAVIAVQSNFGDFANMTDKQFDEAATHALNFSKAFEIDLGRATQVAGQMLKTGLVTDANQAFDLLTAASQKVPVSLREDLLDATDEYGPFFHALGLSGEDAMNALVKASAKGMYGLDKTGDALKEFTIRATDMSTASKVGFDILGMSQEDMSGKLLAGGETANKAFQQILDGIMGIKDPVKQSQAALALFGTPLEDLSVEEIPQFIDGLRKSTNVLGEVEGAAGRMGAQLNSGPGAAFQLFKNRLIAEVAPAAESLFKVLAQGMEAISSSDTVIPALAAAFRGVGTAIGAVIGFFREHEIAAKALAGVVAVVSGVVVAAWVAQGAVATVNAAKSVAAWFATATASTTSATIQSRSTAQIVVGWLAASGSAVVNAAKIVAAWAVSVAQTGVLMAMYAAQSVSAAAKSAAAWVVAQARTVASLAMTGAAFVAQSVVMLASMAATAAGVVAGWVLMGVQSLIQAARMAAAWLIAMGPVGWVIAAVIALVALIIANWDKIVRWTTQAWTAVTNFVKNAAETIRNWVVEKFTLLRDSTLAIFTKVRDLVIGIWTNFRDSIVAGAQWIWDKVLFIFRAYQAGVVLVFTTIRNLVTGIWNGLRDAVVAGAKWIWDKVTFIFNAYRAGVILAFTIIRNTVVGVWTNLRDTVVNGAQAIWNLVVSRFNLLRNSVVSIFTGIRDTVGRVWDGLLAKVRTPIRIVFDFVNSKMIGPVNSILSKFPGGLRIPSLPRLASGGLLQGPGTGTSDSILGVDPRTGVPVAAVSSGEYVLKQSRVRELGVDFLDRLNREGLAGIFGVPRRAEGGLLGNIWDRAKNAVSSVKNFATDMLIKGARKAAESVLGPIVSAAKRLLPNQVPLTVLSGGLDRIYKAILSKGDEQDKLQTLSDGRFGSSRPSPNGIGRLGPRAAAARAFVMRTFGLTNIGGYAPRNIAGTGKRSDHALGKAIDVMIPNYRRPSGIAKGNQVASYFVNNASRWGVKYVIWRDQINSGRGWRPYGHPGGGRSDTLQHRDHNHVSFFDSGGLWGPGTAGINLTSGVERVLSPPQDDYFRKFVDQTQRREIPPAPTVHLYTPDIPHALRALRAAEQEREALAPTWQ